MVILKHFALLLLLACFAQQILVSDCEKGQGRKGRRDGKGQTSGGEERQPEQPPAAANGKTQRGKGYLQGKFSTKDKTKCTWLADEADTVTLGVDCEKGGVGFNCEYSARPTTCAPYASNAKLYWKQIARALKKQRNICEDAKALIKAGMCKKAPKDAHFKLSISGPAPPAVQPENGESSSAVKPENGESSSAVQPDNRESSPAVQPENRESSPAVQPENTRQSSSDDKSCPDKIDQKKLAEEYCSGSWVTLCNFFFTMVQSEDC